MLGSLPPPAALGARKLPAPREARELSRRWEVRPRLSGRRYWLEGRRRRGGAVVIGGAPSRRGRGRYIRGVPVAAQAVGLLECGAAAETRTASWREGAAAAGRRRRSAGRQPPEGQPRRARNWV